MAVDVAASVTSAGALEWPGVCHPLFESSDTVEYPWRSYCDAYSYDATVSGLGSSSHRDALLCSIHSRWHHALVCEMFRVAVGCPDEASTAAVGPQSERKPRHRCTQTAVTYESLQAGLRRGQSSFPAGAGPLVETLLVGALPRLLSVAPPDQISFRGFLAMYVVAMLCLGQGNYSKGIARRGLNNLRPEPQGLHGCRDLVVEHFHHVFGELSDALHSRSSGRARIFALLPEGPLGAFDAEHADVQHFDSLPDNLPWVPFVVRVPLQPSEAEANRKHKKQWVGLQEAWGWQNAWSAVRLAALLDDLVATKDARGFGDEAVEGWLDIWLESLGSERQAMLDGRPGIEGEQQHVGALRWRGSQRTLTPIAGSYRPAWRAALLRRAKKPRKRGRATPGLEPPFELPEGGERGARCGAVVSWAELPVDCDQAAEPLMAGEPDGKLEGLVPTSRSSNLGGGCRLVLNRAVLLTPTDAEALKRADECSTWYGVSTVKHNASYASRPQWLHPGPITISLLQYHVLPHLLRNIFSSVGAAAQAMASALYDCGSCAAGHTNAARNSLLDAVKAIAALSFYLFNLAPYTRGSAAIGILSHHSMLLWLLRPLDLGRGELARHRLQALRCFPRWRAGAMPDVEAAASQTVERYVEEAYWESFEQPAAAAREQLLDCLLAGSSSSAASAKDGRDAARRLQSILAALEERRSR